MRGCAEPPAPPARPSLCDSTRSVKPDTSAQAYCLQWVLSPGWSVHALPCPTWNPHVLEQLSPALGTRKNPRGPQRSVVPPAPHTLTCNQNENTAVKRGGPEPKTTLCLLPPPPLLPSLGQSAIGTKPDASVYPQGSSVFCGPRHQDLQKFPRREEYEASDSESD